MSGEPNRQLTTGYPGGSTTEVGARIPASTEVA